MRINAWSSVEFDFDDEGKQRVEEAAETLEFVADVYGKVVGGDDLTEQMRNVKSFLETIVERKVW